MPVSFRLIYAETWKSRRCRRLRRQTEQGREGAWPLAGIVTFQRPAKNDSTGMGIVIDRPSICVRMGKSIGVYWCGVKKYPEYRKTTPCPSERNLKKIKSLLESIPTGHSDGRNRECNWKLNLIYSERILTPNYIRGESYSRADGADMNPWLDLPIGPACR